MYVYVCEDCNNEILLLLFAAFTDTRDKYTHTAVVRQQGNSYIHDIIYIY
jgi:hypothetical protein